MAVHTSRITTKNGGHLTVQPNSAQTKVLSFASDNPGTTPVSCGTGSNEVKKLVITQLTEKPVPQDSDWLMIHDTSTGQIKKIKVSSL